MLHQDTESEHPLVFPFAHSSEKPATTHCAAIRARLGCTQLEFAALLNVPKVTAISWENGTRKPSGAALRLLAVAKWRRRRGEARAAVGADEY